jgi:hypothetical protein
MIVVDESIHNLRTLQAIAAWYPGRVISIKQLRPNTNIKDDGIAMLLQQATEPTFVTINVDDFWLKIDAYRSYCIVACELLQGQAPKVPGTLRRLFHLPQFHTKALRMGKVIRVRPTLIEYYESDHQIHTLAWPEE